MGVLSCVYVGIGIGVYAVDKIADGAAVDAVINASVSSTQAACNETGFGRFSPIREKVFHTKCSRNASVETLSILCMRNVLEDTAMIMLRPPLRWPLLS